MLIEPEALSLSPHILNVFCFFVSDVTHLEEDRNGSEARGFVAESTFKDCLL